MAGKKTLDEIVQEKVAKEVANLKKDLSSELQKTIASTFSSAFGPGGTLIGAGLGTALDSVITGKKIDVRGLINNSNSQIGEQLAGLINSAQRNF